MLGLKCLTAPSSSGNGMKSRELRHALRLCAFGDIASSSRACHPNVPLGQRVGLVVGATHPDACAEIRRLAPNALFLMPGLGAQGGTPEAIAISSGPDGFGAFASSSRSVLYGFGASECATEGWGEFVQQAAAAEARRLRDSIRAALKP